MELQEKFLHHIWDQRHLIHELKTVSGKAVKIVYQGQYNTANGPDFKNAIISIDGENLQGDVEIHQKTYDWTAHQHDEDPAYNSTILHVVMEHRSSMAVTIREDAKPIEILEIKDQIDADIAKLFAVFQETKDKPRKGLCDFFKLSSNEQLILLLKSYGWERFVRKVSRYNAELLFNSFEQLLYNGIMEAMGYDKNKSNTLLIAHNFPWDKLCRWNQQGLDTTSLAAIWLNYADLFPKAEKLLPNELVQHLKQAFELQSFTTEKSALRWNLFRIRPANHPVKRIIQAAILVSNMQDKGLLKPLENILSFETDKPLKMLSARFSELFCPVDEHLNLIEKPGKTFILTIIGNVMLPILHLYSDKTNNTELKKNIRQLFMGFPPLQDNYITSFMKGYLDDEQWQLINASYACQQGLMNVYFRFCIYRLCDLCKTDRQRCLTNL